MNKLPEAVAFALQQQVNLNRPKKRLHNVLHSYTLYLDKAEKRHGTSAVLKCVSCIAVFRVSKKWWTSFRSGVPCTTSRWQSCHTHSAVSVQKHDVWSVSCSSKSTQLWWVGSTCSSSLNTVCCWCTSHCWKRRNEEWRKSRVAPDFGFRLWLRQIRNPAKTSSSQFLGRFGRRHSSCSAFN